MTQMFLPTPDTASPISVFGGAAISETEVGKVVSVLQALIVANTKATAAKDNAGARKNEPMVTESSTTSPQSRVP